MEKGGEDLGSFKVVVQFPVAWGEMDSFGHVNNIYFFRYFENARISYFEQVGIFGSMKELGIGPILASTQCKYISPLFYPDTIHVGARIRQVQEDRFFMEYRVFGQDGRKLAAIGEGLLVSYDYRNKAKVPLPLEWKKKIQEIEGLS